ncbi:ABC transporter ATP-binding protein [Simiduia agarivorans]|uniref:ABC transporter ATP-binding protein n=1 Tax=Simiduia agarivorans (strain DSM 21679 / JCM 13881 / BCRC 17597 / SA1) TaxID=1117647 RepID=K4KQ12_SIMAS|nr:ABC transporter ATP-binding protein [Simiduia agarivorans]AFV00351.1 ABC transporter ATP-binding protein [Simiduia agarivorans SA1 = DSM 21679]
MLEVTNLTRFYGDYCAVDDVSFSAKPGEILGLLGHNGAGKTTIMKMISGFLEPDAGSIRFDGQDCTDTPQHLQQQLGYLPESLPVYPELTVANYLDYAADIKGLSGDRKIQAIQQALAVTDLSDTLHKPIQTLSRGYRQRVGVAQAIIGKPKLIILDEPTNGLDPSQIEHMRNAIRALAENSLVILSTHILQEVEALCDRVLIISHGKLAVDESLPQLRQSDQLAVKTNLPESDARKIFMLEGVAQMESIEGGYRLQLHQHQNPEQAAHRVAEAVIKNGHQLFGLMPEKRTLEALFHQITGSLTSTAEEVRKEELSHAE